MVKRYEQWLRDHQELSQIPAQPDPPGPPRTPTPSPVKSSVKDERRIVHDDDSFIVDDVSDHDDPDEEYHNSTRDSDDDEDGSRHDSVQAVDGDEDGEKGETDGIVEAWLKKQANALPGPASSPQRVLKRVRNTFEYHLSEEEAATTQAPVAQPRTPKRWRGSCPEVRRMP